MNLIIFRPSRRGQSIAHTVALHLLATKNKPLSLRDMSSKLSLDYPSLKGVLLKYIKLRKAFLRVGRAHYRLTAAQAAFMKKYYSNNSVVDETKTEK